MEEKYISDEALYAIYIQYPNVTIDSRSCKKDDFFIALTGENFDGNIYAQKALDQGCSYALIDNPDYYIDKRTLLVKHCLFTMQRLARRHRDALGLPVLAITGTNGKTTTKELITKVLRKKYKTLSTLGNFNNNIGVPLTLLRLRKDDQLAIIEMGASHLGDITELVQIANPDYGLITNVGQAHLEGFGSFEGVLQTKSELYDYLRNKKAMIFLHTNNPYLCKKAKGLKNLTYGTSHATIEGCLITANPYVSFTWHSPSQEALNQVKTHLIGHYNLDNLLATIAVGYHFGVPATLINEAITQYKPKNNRSQLEKTSQNTLIIDTYNANPTSMEAALTNFATLTANPKALILGDMRELGKESLLLHSKVIETIKRMDLDRILLCGDQFGQVGKDFETYATTKQLCEALKKTPLKGYHILVKGSHGMHLEETLPFL